MKWSEGRTGRIFVLRLEEGDRIPGEIEEFCVRKSLSRGLCFVTGGVKSGKIVAGPSHPRGGGAEPLVKDIRGVYEISGTGTIFPDEQSIPRLHMHASLGRGGVTITGCVRKGVVVWKLGEAVILEIDNTAAVRKFDPALGFSLLEP